MTILTALAEAPRSLSALSRDLELSTATVHAILTTLGEAGWVQKDAARQFSLGPSFLALAQRAVHPEAAMAEAVCRLAAELSMPMSVSARFGEVLIVVQASASDGAQPPEVGQHTPYAVPFGPVFAAYDTEQSQEAWLARSGELSRAALQELRSHLATIRQRGFSVERLGPSALRLVQVLQDVRTDPTSEVLEPLTQALLSEIVQTGLEPGPGRHPVTTIVAPVLDADGRLTHTLNAHPFRSMTATEATAVAHRLVAAAASFSSPSS